MIPRCIFVGLMSCAGLWATVAKAQDGRNPTGDSAIRGPFAGSEIVLTTTARLAGAIHSLTWGGQEFIDSADHGRQLQSASSFDNRPDAGAETFNPTEAGSRLDGSGPCSTSQLLEIQAANQTLRTLTQMAFWLAPGERSEGQLARNLERLSRHRLRKEVHIGRPGWPNVIDYTATFELPENEPHQTAQFEALTGYMPPEFSVFYRFVRSTKKLEPLSDGPGEQSEPVVLATPDGRFAMGIFSPDLPPPHGQGPTYGRFRFGSEKVVKWNCVFRVHDGVPAGEHPFHLVVALGTLADVGRTFEALAVIR